MVRQFISTVALVACTAVYASAAQQVTFVLSNGQRVSGQLAAGNNFNNNQLRLNNQNYPLDQVAVIDVAGGTPSQLELSRITKGNSVQAVVMRSGHAEAGRLINITGDSVQWQDHNGRDQNYPLSDVARIYLNTRNAPAALGASGTTGSSSIPTAAQPAPAGSIAVPANQQWTPTGIGVRKGEVINFQSSGQIQLSSDSGDVSSPSGSTRQRKASGSPLPNEFAGALIGKIGVNGQPFAIGGQTSLPMPAAGPLYLGINDDGMADNNGQFYVVITRSKR
jgi:hypothetical protein